jgi:hypothetical protein
LLYPNLTLKSPMSIVRSFSFWSLEDHFRTFVLREEQMLHQIIIYYLEKYEWCYWNLPWVL